MVVTIQAATDPSAVLDDRGAPLPERTIEIELEVLRRGIQQAADERRDVESGRDLPQRDDPAMECNAGLSQDLTLVRV
jgi:hypothetical protein